MFALHLYQRLAEGTGYDRDLTRWARYTWRRTTRAMGGYWTGDFVISGASALELQNLYSTMIGKRVIESSYGVTTWEGEIVGLSLTLNGVTHEQSMDYELWHNNVKVQYTYPSAQDIEQGGVLDYVLPGGDPGFQDTLQDFGEWETLGAGESVYQIKIQNDDGTETSGYLGEATQTVNPDDSIWVFKDRGRGLAGFNGTVGANPLTYVVSDIDNASTQKETAWSEDVASSDIYGESGYIEVLPEECYAATAEAARDRRLVDYAFPRSFPAGGLSSDEPQSGGNQLSVTCAGYVFSMNRRFYETNVEPLDVSVQITTLVAASEYVTDGGILENATISSPLTGDDMAFKIWDELEGLALLGDTSGNRYVAGVTAGRLFHYDLAETEMRYEWRNGQLRYATGQLVPATLITPDIIVRLEAPLVIAGPGQTFQVVTQAVITECEFIAPRSYRLIPADGDVLEGTY